jgi:hypothetical protein
LGVDAVRDEVDDTMMGAAQHIGQGKRKGVACWLVDGACRCNIDGGSGSQQRMEMLWRWIRWPAAQQSRWWGRSRAGAGTGESRLEGGGVNRRNLKFIILNTH